MFRRKNMYDPGLEVENYIRICGGNAQELPEEFETIRVDQDPSYIKWKFIPHYKLDNNGNQRIWQVGFDGQYRWTLHGPLTKTTIVTMLVETNNSGRNLYSQAKQECTNLMLKKYRKGYQPLTDDSEKNVVGMKGYPYEEGCIKDWPVLVSFKLDGIRLLASVKSNKVKCLSYGNVSLDYITHIREQLEEFMPFLPPSTTTDGELYNHNMEIHEIQSAVKSNVNISPEITRICYYIFDIYWDENPPMDDRYNVICRTYNKYKEYREYINNITTIDNTNDTNNIITTNNSNITCNNAPLYIRILPQSYCYNHDDIIRIKNIAIANGYEGVTIRHSSVNRTVGSKKWEMSRYKFGRSRRLFKLKDYLSDEGMIESIEHTKGKEKDLCKLIVITRCGERVGVRYGSAVEKRLWRSDPSLVVGKILEYSYTHLHPESNIPQQIKGIRMRPHYA